MKNELIILEHEILKIILDKNSTRYGMEYKIGSDQMPIFKRDFESFSLHFGTLVDILNNPKNYEEEKSLSGIVTPLEKVKLNNYQWIDVSDAIDVLVANKHVQEILCPDKFSKPTCRKILLTNKGAIDYRTNFYYNEYERIDAIKRGYEIQRKDHWLKKYWYIVELSKYIIGGVVGSAITLFFGR